MDRQVTGAPAEILKRYEKWKDIAAMSDPTGLRLIKAFRDEALAGEWKGYRSSRLGVERAKVLARALKCHPGVLVFPGWTHEKAA